MGQEKIDARKEKYKRTEGIGRRGEEEGSLFVFVLENARRNYRCGDSKYCHGSRKRQKRERRRKYVT